MTSSGQTQFYHPPQPSFLRYRSKPLESSGTGHRHSAIRHSGDFDLFTGARPGVLASSSATRLPGLGQGRPINNVFRRAKSTEWDRDVLANNVAGLRPGVQHQSNTLTDFHLGLSNSNMQTLDKRISASTDQLDCIREVIRDGGRPRQYRTQRHNERYDKHGPDGVKNTDYYLGKSDNYLNKDRGGGGRKTPFEIFLEDDGPYSRKLYGPVSESSKTKTSTDKVTTSTSSRNISSSKSTEYLDKTTQDYVERDLRSISAIKKGLLWQQRDKLFSRSFKIFF